MSTLNPCALLERLIREPNETQWLEFKLNTAIPQEIGEYVSALANSAMLADRDRAFIVFGIEDRTHRKIGTTVRLHNLKKGGEPLANWLTRLLEPKLMLEFLDFTCDNIDYSILIIEPTYDRPVQFSGIEYIRVGESKRKLKGLTEHTRALWLATGRRRFEDAVALPHQHPVEVLSLLDVHVYYRLSGTPRPRSDDEIIEKLTRIGAIRDDMEGGFDITNLGAIVFAKQIRHFPSISSKSVRLIRYSGTDKTNSEYEQEGVKGYAVGFQGLIEFIKQQTPSKEIFERGVRRRAPLYPEIAIREITANALIHQDFTIGGAGPVIEIYDDRIEVISPGSSLIEADRLLDERRSRNQKLAALMRDLGICEERGGGLDKALAEVEVRGLPAPDFMVSPAAVRVIIFGPRDFSALSKKEKMRACFYHCVLRWLKQDYMSNSTLRARFGLADENYQAVSAIISESMKSGRILPAEPGQGRRNAKYIPYFAG